MLLKRTNVRSGILAVVRQLEAAVVGRAVSVPRISQTPRVLDIDWCVTHYLFSSRGR